MKIVWERFLETDTLMQISWIIRFLRWLSGNAEIEGIADADITSSGVPSAPLRKKQNGQDIVLEDGTKITLQ